MTALVVLAADGELRISSLVVAERTEIQHKAVLQLVRNNVADFEAFGRVAFEMAPFETAGGVQRREVAHLNEQQATLLVTYMRNSEIVRAFKLELVKQFYAMREALMRPALPQTFAEALEAAAAEARKVEALQARVAADAPKVRFADTVAASPSTILIGELAKILRSQGVQTGANRLFETLRTEGYLIRRNGTDHNMPTQKAMELGLFEITERVGQSADGEPQIYKTSRVTGKGQQYFIDRYAPHDGVLNLQAVAS